MRTIRYTVNITKAKRLYRGPGLHLSLHLSDHGKEIQKMPNCKIVFENNKPGLIGKQWGPKLQTKNCAIKGCQDTISNNLGLWSAAPATLFLRRIQFNEILICC